MHIPGNATRLKYVARHAGLFTSSILPVIFELLLRIVEGRVQEDKK